EQPRDRVECFDSRGIRARRLADQKRLAHPQDITAFESCRRLDSDHLAMLSQLWLDAPRLGLPRGSAHRAKNGDFIQNEGRVFDKCTIGEMTIDIERRDDCAAAGQKPAVLRMLPQRQLKTDRIAADKRSLAMLHF